MLSARPIGFGLTVAPPADHWDLLIGIGLVVVVVVLATLGERYGARRAERAARRYWH